MTTRQQQHNTVENTTTANTHKNTPVRSSDDDAYEDNEDNSDNSDDGDNDKDDDDDDNDVTQEI